MKTAVLTMIATLLTMHAHAGTKLNCQIGDTFIQGTANIEVLDVVGEANLKLLKVELVTGVQRPGVGQGGKKAHLVGLLAGQITGQSGLVASGTVYNQSGSDDNLIINPDSITLQGQITEDGKYELRLSDSNRVLQLGFGVGVDCAAATK